MDRQRPFSLAITRSLPLAVLTLLLIAHCSLLTVRGQTATATLSGTVEDQNRAVVPGAAIVVQNSATSLKREVTTNDEGSFTVPLLPPGTYTVTVRRDGFTPVEVSNVVLNVGDQKSLQVHLKAGDISEMVQIEGDAALINTSPAVGTTIDRQFVGNLPLNGRSFQSLILLTPGVTVSTTNIIDGGQFSVNGQRASTNYFTVDGVSANFGISAGGGSAKSLALTGAYPGTSAMGGTNNLVSIDALEEFKIQTSSYTAESGRQPGGQVQIVTRAGKNDFHGTLFEYIRNEAFDARNYFNRKPAPQTPLRQNQFGGTFSGPVFFPNFGDGGSGWYNGKNQTFFFFSYEGQRLRLPANGTLNVPSLRVRNVVAAPTLRPLLNAFPNPTGPETTTTTVCTPSPNDPSCAPNGRRYSGFAPFNYGIGNPNNLDSTGLRIDHAVNSKLTLFGRFNESPSNSESGIVTFVRSIARTSTFTFGAVSILSKSMTNDVRFNYSRQQAKTAIRQSALGGAVPVDPAVVTNGLPGHGALIFTFGSTSMPAIQAGTQADAYQRQFNIVDNLSVILGEHSLKFGIDFRRLLPVYGSQDGQNVFFLQETTVQSGIVSSMLLQTIQPSEPRFDNYSAYIQDTWKVLRTLTLDLGLRWEINPPPTEAEGRVPPLAIGIIGTDVHSATLAPAGTQFYKTFWTAFAPRLGAAYQLKRTPGRETVLRGGFGVYYDLGSGNAGSGWPIIANRSLPSPQFPSCPAPIPFPVPSACAVRPGIVSVTTLPTSSAVHSNENVKLPYSLHWNFSVEQSLGKEQTVSVSYVASAGRRLLTQQLLNIQPRHPVTGALLPRPNPNFAAIIYSFNGPTSDYYSMQTQYRVRMKQNLQVLMNYTWAHAIDEVSTDASGGGSGVLERGNANFDVRHNFSAAINYDLPRVKAGPVLGWLFRDWSSSAIVHAQSGRPVNILGGTTFIREDGASFLVRPDLILGVPLYTVDSTVPGGRRFNAAAFAPPPQVCAPVTPTVCINVPTRQGNFGRNVLRELPLHQVDVALGRTFKFTERLGLQLRGEAFNVFNHPMFAGYGLSATSPATFGVPQTTLNAGLGGLSSLYQLGGPRSIQLSARFSF
ncbi:MAG TPA: TonB-dependent receptor [Pyrinomonadaceae bacterium]|nr:TonB-dependent receptor [Pyrinomonadaceae bacterium]